ncbi:hypothetical protein JQ629_11975 [Bradyrhizobium sp. AUGA SZCCT0222]|uniref:hypothetical protein n=1 Tax=Bradyrhizobium sp. AUGA SZCCT0222 TaxID=2807668 RepID=UPI001BAA9629|nr:hypothetical protein [Bradyrhizobium sp. AUGA SZCCT0222]MBR1268227.1 hypothetical protein [Bradyrhizobium sp. AUGA SZCCT0222]
MQDGRLFLLGTPRDDHSLRLSPHSANIDRTKFEQQCGGILAQAQPDFARVVAISEHSLVDPQGAARHDPPAKSKKTR